MKKYLIPTVLFVSIISCTNEGVDKESNLLLREVEYNLETGAQMSEKTYSYDDNENLIHENFVSTIDPRTSFETLYEYDESDRMLVRKTRGPYSNNLFYITEFEYSGDLLLSETNSYENSPGNWKIVYYYTGSSIDSTQYLQFSQPGETYVVFFSTAYHYDDQHRLTGMSRSGLPGEGTFYTYASDHISSTCEYYDIYGQLRGRCLYNEYNSAWKIVAIRESSEMVIPSTDRQLQEERFYNGDLLEEKRVYTYYNAGGGDNVLITRTKYEYGSPD